MTARDILSQPPPGFDLRLAYGVHPQNFCEIRLASDPKNVPLIIFFHGGFWRAAYDLSHAGHICEAFRRLGINTANVEYRRVGCGGGWPIALDDIRTAYRYIVEHAAELDLKVDRLLVMGHSAGAHLAACLAAYETGVRSCVTLAGVLDLSRAWELHLSSDAVAEFIGGTPSEVPERYRAASPIQLNIPHVRQLIVHGRQDDVVPWELSKSYCDTKRKLGERVECVWLEGAGHFELVDPSTPVFQQVAKAVLKVIDTESGR